MVDVAGARSVSRSPNSGVATQMAVFKSPSLGPGTPQGDALSTRHLA